MTLKLFRFFLLKKFNIVVNLLMIYKLKKICFIISIFRSSIHQLRKKDFSTKKKSKTKIITKDKHKFIYITNINHITQNNKDKIHKFIYKYIYIYILLILATSHKVTKKFFFDKIKTIRPKTWVIDSTKKPL